MNKWLLSIILILFVTNVYALRVNRPPILSFPLTQEQVTELNRYLEDIWNIQNGRFELDVVSSPKTNSKNGEIWVLQTGFTSRIQYKANGVVYSIIP